MVINVVGLGYIGLPTALMFANCGYCVIGTDTNRELITALEKKQVSTSEAGLQDLFINAFEKRIQFSTKYHNADVYIVAVPTPYMSQSKKIDPKFVIEAVRLVLDVHKLGSIIIIESTISPGTIDKYIRPEIESRKLSIGVDIHLVHAPERIIPGKMIYELEHNPRTIGTDDLIVGEKVKELYSSFCKSEITVTDIRTAEMSKVVENTYRDVNIAFANELARICRVDNLDVYKIIEIANKHPRVNILQPGPGVGGHCISVDPWFLVGDYPDLTNLILTARKINDSMPTYVLSRIREIMRERNITKVTDVGLYGLSYKENVDDIRESPTLQLLHKMDENLAFGIKVFDPLIHRKVVDNQLMDFDNFLREIKILVIMTAHDHIKENLELIKSKIVLDTRNICSFEGVYKL